MTVLGIAPAVRSAVAPKVADDVPDELDESRPAEVAGDPTDVLKSAFGDDIVEE